MGVKDLATFCNKYKDLFFERVSIAHKAEEYKSKYEKIPELVIDLNSCLYYIYDSHRPYLSGTQYKEFANLLEKLILKFQSIGLQITGFLTGVKTSSSVTKMLERRKKKRDFHREIFDKLRSGPKELKFFDRHVFYPQGLWITLVNVFRKCNCKIYQTKMARDIEISRYLRDNDCFGLLSYDTDFIIFNCANFFSMKHLNWDALTTYLIKYENLADILQIDAKLIPLWATLADNSFLSQKSTESFYNILNSYNFEVRGTLLKVARFINFHFNPDVDLNDQILSFARNAYPDLHPSIAKSSIVKSLQYYDLNSPHHEYYSLRYSRDPNLREFQNVVLEKHQIAEIPKFFFGILFELSYSPLAYPEDWQERNNNSFQMVLKIRRKIYGILLQNKNEKMVNEFYVDVRGVKCENLENPIPSRVNVDVLELWRQDESDTKWDLFFLSLNMVSRDILLLELPHIYIPAFALKYMIMDRMDIKSWELEAIIVSMLLLKDYSIQDLESIKDIPIDAHAMHLYWIWTKMIDVVTLLNFTCGCPIKPEFTDPAWFQDGQLFHKKYLDAKTNCELLELCEGREDIFNSTLKIKRFVLGNRNHPEE